MRNKKKAKELYPYKSELELKVAECLGDSWEYEAECIEYTTTHVYTPDFVKGDVYVEVKGFFRPGDQKKYLAIRDTLADSYGKMLVFIFSNPNKPVRKGAKLTMAQWADKHGIEWYSLEDIKDGWN